MRRLLPAVLTLAALGTYIAGPRSYSGLRVVALHTTDETVAASLPIGGTAGAQNRTIMRVVVPVEPGDLLDITGRARVTNDVAGIRYTVGVGFWIGGYDVDDGVPYADKTWVQMGAWSGDNVTPDRHHMPMVLTGDLYEVPADWPAGHRIVVVFRADAHSTQWAANGGGDVLTVDGAYDTLTVRQYREG